MDKLNVLFSTEELGTLKRLLKHELHEELQFENNAELMKGSAWKEQHEEIVLYKLNLLKKLGSTVSRADLKRYDLQ